MDLHLNKSHSDNLKNQYITKRVLNVLCSVCSVVSSSLTSHGLYVIHQAPLSMVSFRQEYWSGFPFPPPGDLPDQGSNHISCISCTGRWILYHCTTWEASWLVYHLVIYLLSLSIRGKPGAWKNILGMWCKQRMCIWSPWECSLLLSLADGSAFAKTESWVLGNHFLFL